MSNIDSTGHTGHTDQPGSATSNLARLGIDRLNPMQLFMQEHAAAPFIMLQAPTGSGKTVAFVLPMLAEADAGAAPGVRALVIAPSRELVVQIADVTRRLAPAGVKVTALYGGHDSREEKLSLSVTPGVVVATPGRLLDHLDGGRLRLDALATLVLDEWDKTLQLGFADEMRAICGHLSSPPRHLILTSATTVADLPPWLPVPPGATPLRADFSGGAAAPSPRIDVVEVPSPTRDKLDTLRDLLLAKPNEPAIVFVNHRESARRVYDSLIAAGLPATLYSGDLDQLQRSQALESFAGGSKPILVATDLAARGIDVEGVRNVIHYHLPLTEDAWTHRNGRTGRQGAPGCVYAITSEADSLAPFMRFDRSYTPGEPAAERWAPKTAMLYFNVGKKDKISRGDIVGFLIAKGGLQASDIGRISLSDRSALVAVNAAKAPAAVNAVRNIKIKNKRVLVSLAKNS